MTTVRKDKYVFPYWKTRLLEQSYRSINADNVIIYVSCMYNLICILCCTRIHTCMNWRYDTRGKLLLSGGV